MEQAGNNWAVLTQVDTRFDSAPIYSDGIQFGRIRGNGIITFTGMAPATLPIMKAMEKWMYSKEPRFPFYESEWMCLYCGSPNKLPETHCDKCGAPRNWLIG